MIIISDYSNLGILYLVGFLEVHTERLNEELSVRHVMNSVTVKEETNEIDRSCGQKWQHSV